MSEIKTIGSGNHTLYDTDARAEINTMTTATADDVGKALKAKTVSGGKVTEWEFGEAGIDVTTNSRLDMITEVSTDSSPQLVDISAYTYGQVNASLYQYSNVIIDFSKNGKYYNNPLGYCKPAAIQLYDANDTLLTFGDGAYSSFETDYLAVIERVDDTTLNLIGYASEADFKANIPRSINTRTFSGSISYAKIGHLWTQGTSKYYGITFNCPTNVYIPYGYDVTYNEEMVEDVFDGFVDNRKFEEIPEGMLSPWMHRNYTTTDNLLDNRKIDWNPNSSTYLQLKYGETIPVTGGTTIMCNKGMDVIKWYDSSGNATEIGNKGAYVPLELPSEATYITFSKLWPTQITNGYEPVYMYYVDKLYPYDDVNRNPLPMAQINGYDINKNLYNQCIPDETSEVVRMMKTFAIREINRRQNAFRFGTFNVYVQRQQTNKEVIRKMMGTYGIDACGFQESMNYQDSKRYNLGDYLKGWQFGYCSTAEEDTASARHIVSAMEIASSEAFSIGSGNNTCLKCVINMPRYKDYVDGLTTLSYYTYHGLVSSDTEREAEVNDILAKVALDTSDFIIVCGDTNDFSGQPNYTYDRWAQFSAAGLTPVHDGKSSTVTDPADGKSLDQIFISSNITCLYYDVISSYEWMYTPPGSSTSVPVSDHDLVFADLQFDFDAVIEAKRNS